MSKEYKTQQEQIFTDDVDHNFKFVVKEAQAGFDSRIYWEPTRLQFNKKLKEIQKSQKVSKKKALVLILDSLDEILKDSQKGVMRLVRQRKKDEQQARKSVAGNNYQALVAYALRENVLVDNLPLLHIMVKPKEHPIIEEYGVIKVGIETQKPDMDILIYSDKPKSPLVICSCKTSLRERAGQTYRWKLLLDLATADPEHLKKYPNCPINKLNIQYKKDRKVYVALITADFYGEAKSPQQRGMFEFFDNAFVSKKSAGNLRNLSGIINWLSRLY